MRELLHGLLLLTLGCSSFLIPREKLVTDPRVYSSIALSPDGKTVGYIDADPKGVFNVFVMPLDSRQTRQATFRKEDVSEFHWTGVPELIVFKTYDEKGQSMLTKKNISKNAPRSANTPVTRNSDVRGTTLVANNKRDNFVIVEFKLKNSGARQLVKFDLLTNKLTVILHNHIFTKIIFDNNMNIRMGTVDKDYVTVSYHRYTSNSGSTKPTTNSYAWEEFIRVQKEDASITEFLGFDKNNSNTYWIWGEGSDVGRLIVAPIDDFAQKNVLYNATKGQITNVVIHPKDYSILSYSEYYSKPEIVFRHKSVEDDLRYLSSIRPTDALKIITISDDMETWLITYDSPDSPKDIYIYRRTPKILDFLFNTNPDLRGYALNKQIGFNITARDGLSIQAYISLPPNIPLKHACDVNTSSDKSLSELGMIPVKPQKMILLIHGGPNERDAFGYNPYNALMTSRGYAVLQVNYRASSGFGKKFEKAGNGEWGKKMEDDLFDAVNFAIEKGIANNTQVAVVGFSYGGYAALVGMTFTPDAFACGIDLFGPSNLVTQVEAIDPSLRYRMVEKLGAGIDTEADRKKLEAVSPLFKANKVKKPLLILQGAVDKQVNRKESDQFVDALRNNSIPVSYVLFPDEGHGFIHGPNALASLGIVENFLRDCMGGEAQPFKNGQYGESAILNPNVTASRG